MKTILAALAAIVVVALIAWAGTTHFSSDLESPTITATTGFVGDLTGDVTGDVTGDITGGVTGAVAATTITASSTTVLSGAFDARSTAEFAGAVVDSSTYNVQGAVTADSTVVISGTFNARTGVFLAKAVVCSSTVDVTGVLTATGGVVGDVTGDVTGVIFQTVAEQGNLPAAASNTGECFMNATGDTGWVADNDSYVQLWP